MYSPLKIYYAILRGTLLSSSLLKGNNMNRSKKQSTPYRSTTATCNETLTSQCTELSAAAALCFSHLQVSVKQSTSATYRGIYKLYIEPTLGNQKITSISSKDIDELLYSLSSIHGLSSRTLCLVTTVIRHILRHAKAVGVDLMDLSTIKRPRTIYNKIEILTDIEYQKLLKHCRANPSTENLGILLTLFTGLRIGELCALQWCDIDPSSGILYVNKTVLRINNTNAENDTDKKQAKTKLIIDSPKSIASIRCIPLPNCIRNIVESHRKDDNTYIISGTERLFEPRYYRKLYYKTLDDAGIKRYSYHALRHTFATNCVNLGFNPKILSEILGHSDVSITFNTYIHTSLEAMKRDMCKITLD